MNRKFYRHALRLGLALGVLAIVATVGLAGQIPTRAQGKKLKIVASNTILQDFVRGVSGELADVSSLVPPGGDVHDFEPSTNDIQTIADADLVITNGLNLEIFITKLVEQSGTRAPVIVASRGVGILRFGAEQPSKIIGFSGVYDCTQAGDCDPHAWQDATNVILYILNIRDALIALDGGNADVYRASAAQYIGTVQQLDAEIWQGLSVIPAQKRVLVTNHDALGYFAARYGFKIAGVVLPGGPGKEPAPQDVAALIDLVKAQGVPAIFTENVTNTKLADEIAKQAGVNVVTSLYTDSLGAAGTPGETYPGMMRANVKAIADALK